MNILAHYLDSDPEEIHNEIVCEFNEVVRERIQEAFQAFLNAEFLSVIEDLKTKRRDSPEERLLRKRLPDDLRKNPSLDTEGPLLALPDNFSLHKREDGWKWRYSFSL